MNRRITQAWMGFCLVCCVGFGPPRVYGQGGSAGAISGTITDPTGGVIAEAQVTISNVATGRSQVVRTNASGFYDLEALQSGTYNVTVKKEGFEAFVSEGVKVDPGARVAVNAALQLGSSVTEVTVEAAEYTVDGLVEALTNWS